MTYTTVFKDYEAATFEEAAGMMLRDDVVFKQEEGMLGEQKGYSLDHWRWTPAESGQGGTLRAYFT